MQIRRVRLLSVLVAVAVTVLGAQTTTAHAADAGWVAWAGPTGADSEAWIRTFATAGTTVYAGSEGSGVFRSTNAGITWAKFGTGLSGSSANIRDLDVVGSDVIAATGGGLYKSSNGGSWQPLGQGVGSGKLNAEVQTLHRNGSTWLAGVVGGVYKSTDSGNTWTLSSAGLPAATTVWSMDAYSFLPNKILAATSSGAFVSTNGGANWSPVTDGLPTGTNILRIMPDQVSPTTWYAITSGAGVYRTQTSGLTWQPVNTGLGANLQTRSITQIPVGASYRIVLGTQNGMYTTYDGGESWQPISNDGLAGRTITWAVTGMPGNPASLLAGTQGGGVHYRLMAPPVNTVAPVLSDTTPNVGQTITTTTGTWVGTEEIQYTYEWQRCTTASPASCSQIDGADTSSYTVTSADQNNRLRSVIRVSNPASPPAYGTTDAGNEPSALSSLVAAAAGTLPGATTRPNPTITNGFGSPSVGFVLQVSPGTWVPAATSTTYEWFRCSTVNEASCESAGTTSGASYTVTKNDVDHYMRVKARGANASGTAASDFSSYTSMILPQQVTQTSAPKVFGKPWVGQSAVRSLGSYSGPFENSFTTWQACDTAAGTGCSSIAGSANTASFTLNNGQLGKFVRVKVEIDVNGFNQTPQTLITYSAPVGPVVAAPAKVSTVTGPKISGRAVKTVPLTLSRGSWNGGPTFSQQWYRCTAAGTGCVPIVGAKGLTYTLGAADVNRRIMARVTGINGWGVPVIAQSNMVGPVAAAAKPVYTGGGGITGKARVGKVLTAAKGIWTGIPTPTFTYQWTRNGSSIAKAVSATYKTVKKDKGKKIAVRVTARNVGGTVTVTLPARTVK